MNHLNRIFEKLNISFDTGLYITGKQRNSLFSNRIERLLEGTIKPDAFFCVDNKPLILFYENLGDNKEKKLKDIWNFNETPIVIIAENNTVEIYNGYNYLSDENSLELLGTEEILNDFNYFELVTGNTWKKYQKNLSSSNRIDFHLLNNIKTARALLLEQSISPNLINSLIGKVIFVRYLIDRKVKLDFEQSGISREWTNNEFCSLLSQKINVKLFFDYLKDKFNGDLFPISSYEIEELPIDGLNILADLLSGMTLTSGQKSLFDLYDFSIIPVEFISNVYELFIGQDQQEKQGAYYTPLFLVDYVLAETVEKKLSTQNKPVCKVLDPACGSGIFLVETLRKIIEKYQKDTPNYLNDHEHYRSTLKKLAANNIFGIDKDHNAINVAIFSIYLTLLDYQEPSDIESFKFPLLLNNNFFTSDFFDLDANFNNNLKSVEFDFILGNPPWKRGKGENKEPLFDKYIKKRKQLEKNTTSTEICISNKEVAQAFVLRTSDFSSAKTSACLIITSKILYNIQAAKFRKYFLENFILNRVFELAPVRKEVFNNSNDKAIAPAAVLFFKHADKNLIGTNIVEHISLKPSRFFSLFKLFTIQRSDYKKVSQLKLLEHDFLWKVLVYGNYLDFNLIKRLKNKASYKTISEEISNKDKFLVGQGAMVGGGDKNDATHLIGKPFLDTKKDLQPYWINKDVKNYWQYSAVHRPRKKELYTAPFILIAGGNDTRFRCMTAVSENDAVFKSSLTAIKSLDNSLETLNSMSGILNSSFFSYFGLQTFSSLGIEREESHDTEKLTIPFVKSTNISQLVASIMRLKEQENDIENFMNSNIIIDIEAKIEELNNAIIDTFDFSEEERDLLNYSNEITIPILMKHKGYEDIFNPICINDNLIDGYIHTFLSRFNPIYKKRDKKLAVELRINNQIIGLFFKVHHVNEQIDVIKKSEVEKNSFMQLIHSLGCEKITDKLFIQKDIRGFERNGFYIIKPNEKKLWHKAIGHIDVNEFMDAILKAGKKEKFNV